MQTAVLLMQQLGCWELCSLHPKVQGGIEDANRKADSEVDAREFGSFLAQGSFSPLPLKEQAAGVVIAL